MCKMIKSEIHLKQGICEACNNARNCKMSMRISLTFIKNVNARDWHEGVHFEP
jgi:hypothetical protein